MLDTKKIEIKNDSVPSNCCELRAEQAGKYVFYQHALAFADDLGPG